MTSGIQGEGRFGKQDFVYFRDEGVYRRPAGKKLQSYTGSLSIARPIAPFQPSNFSKPTIATPTSFTGVRCRENGKSLPNRTCDRGCCSARRSSRGFDKG